MTEDDKGALKEVLRGAGVTAFITGAFILVIVLFANLTAPQEPYEQTTKVVGQYQECDIIQWHYGALAEYKYFLHCPK